MSNRFVFVERDGLAPAADRLLADEVDAVRVHAARQQLGQGLFPGAFNPLHDGHQRMIEHAATRLGHEFDFEISVINVDKPRLGLEEIRRRVDQFGHDQVVWLTRAATFVEKARLFPGTTFIVGVDTVQRIADVSYYDQQAGKRDEDLSEIQALGCRFVVFGRAFDSTFVSLSDLDLPSTLSKICTEVSQADFRLDVSSSELRDEQP